MTTSVHSLQLSKPIARRVAIYISVAIGLIALRAAVVGRDWQGSANLHTLMETTATIVCLFIGVMAMVSYSARKRNTILLIGAGFLGTAVLAGIHALVTTELLVAYLPSSFEALTRWSEMASEQFLAILLMASSLAWRRERWLGTSAKLDDRLVCALIVGLAGLIFSLFAFVPLPDMHVFGFALDHLEGLAPTLFLIIALLGFLSKGRWRQDAFEHWLIVALIIVIASQTLFLPFSDWAFDLEFNAAHLLGISGYLCVLSGLLANMYDTFRSEEARANEQQIANKAVRIALAEAARHKRALDAHAIIAVTDIRGQIIYANDKFCEISQYSAAELLGRNHRLICSGHHPPSFFQDMWRTISSGATWQGDIKNRAKDGSTYWVSTTIVPDRNEKGRITKYTAVRTDITARKEAEEQLVEQAESMDLMNEIAVAANQSDDMEAAFKYCLERICRFTGWEVAHAFLVLQDEPDKFVSSDWWYCKDEIRYAPYVKATYEVDWQANAGLAGRVMASGRPHYFADITSGGWWPRMPAFLECGLKGGAAFPVKIKGEVVAILDFWAPFVVTASPQLIKILAHTVSQLGQVVERQRSEQKLVAHRDDLQRRVDEATAALEARAAKLSAALAREQELSELQRQFVSMASHEFRTPLAIIDSATQRLTRRNEEFGPDDLASHAERVREAVSRMTNLIESTLTAARTDARKLTFEFGCYDQRALLEECCDRQREIGTGNRLICDFDDLPEKAYGDRQALEQSFGNLLANAVKYSPAGTNIHVKGWREGDTAVVTVEDTGVGIDADDVPKIFERYFRAKTSSGIPGTGIGLSLVRMFIEAHGGTVAVESESGRGSTFTVRLPIQASDQSADPPSASVAA